MFPKLCAFCLFLAGMLGDIPIRTVALFFLSWANVWGQVLTLLGPLLEYTLPLAQLIECGPGGTPYSSRQQSVITCHRRKVPSYGTIYHLSLLYCMGDVLGA